MPDRISLRGEIISLLATMLLSRAQPFRTNSQSGTGYTEVVVILVSVPLLQERSSKWLDKLRSRVEILELARYSYQMLSDLPVGKLRQVLLLYLGQLQEILELSHELILSEISIQLISYSRRITLNRCVYSRQDLYESELLRQVLINSM